MKYLNTKFDLESDELVEVLDETPVWSAPFGLKLLEYVKIRKNITVLDIGFGAGFPFTELAMRLGDSCKVYGIDPWKAAIKRTQKKIDFYGIKNTGIIEGVAESIPLGDGTVDLIVSNNGINNVSDLNKVLSECSRVIKSKGQFLLAMNLDTTMTEFYEILKQVLLERSLHASIENMERHIYEKRRPLNEIAFLLEKNNFVVRDVIEDKFEYKFADGTTMLNYFFIRLAFMDSWKNLIPANRQVEIFKETENRMNKKAGIDGFFKLSVPFAVIDCEKK